MTEPVRPPSPDLPAPPRSRDLPAPPSPVLQQPSAQPAHAGDTRPSISLGSVTSVAGSRTSNSKTTLIGMSIVGLLLAGGGVLAVALGGRASSEDTSDEVVQSDDSAGGLGDSSDSGDSLDSDGPTGRNLDSAAADESSLGSPDGSSPQPSLDESSGTSQDSASIYMERDEIYGEAVAVVWSQVANADDPSWAETVQEQVDQYRASMEVTLSGFGETNSGRLREAPWRLCTEVGSATLAQAPLGVEARGSLRTTRVLVFG